MENSFMEKEREIYIDIENISDLNKEISITTDVIKKFFTITTIKGDGNCLFNAISYALIGNQGMSNDLRRVLYDFYKTPIYERIQNGEVDGKFEETFYISTLSDAEMDYVRDDKHGTFYRHNDKRGEYVTDNIIKTRQLNSNDYLGVKFKEIPHIENIQYNGVFGSNGDVIAFCYLLGKNIIVIKQDGKQEDYHSVMPYIINNKYEETIYLQLIGEAHYQILEKRVRQLTSPSSIRHSRKSRSPSPKKVGSPRDTRKSKSPTTDTRKSRSPNRKSPNRNTRKSPIRNKTIKIDPDEKNLQELIQTHERLNQSINEFETLLGKLKKNKDTDNASQVNNGLKRQKLELKQIEKEIHKITGTEFSIRYEIQKLFGI